MSVDSLHGTYTSAVFSETRYALNGDLRVAYCASTRRRLGTRFWTRLGVASMGAHVFYELGSGVAMPFASLAGPVPAATGWAAGTIAAWRTANRVDERYNTVIGVMNGIFLTAVLAHFIYWPKRWINGVPLLTECEGLRGRV